MGCPDGPGSSHHVKSETDSNSAATRSPPPSSSTQTLPDSNTTAITRTTDFAEGSPAWTDAIPRTEHTKLFFECQHWPASLGPPSEWPLCLRLYVTMLFNDTRPVYLYWGPDRVAIYNEQAATIAGGAHPSLMGRPGADGFPEIWDAVEGLISKAQAAGSIDVEDLSFYVERNGYLEETYFIGQFIAVRRDDGEVGGIYNTAYESTRRVLYDRRRRIVDNLASIKMHSTEQTLSLIVDALSDNPRDIPMAMLYAFDDLAGDGQINLRRCGTIGIPDGHGSAPREACLESDASPLLSYFRQAKSSNEPVVISNKDALFSTFEGITWLGHGEPSETIIVVSLSSGGAEPLGFYVQGINPRNRYDKDYEVSIIDIVRQMEATWVASLSFQRGKLREAALQRRVNDSENRLHHMARHAPLGMVQISLNRTVQWANDQYYEMTGHDPADPDMASFFANVASEQKPYANDNLDELIKGRQRTTDEWRLNRKWTPPVEEEGAEESHVWILALAFPLLDENGKVELVMGYVSDISHQKWAESVQSRQAAAATKARERQEAFIDTTSHEMRNPLTAITQLADGIANCLKGPEPHQQSYYTTIQENVDAATTILACAAHQKRVIDDILLLSRLESRMLSITPIVERAEKIVHDCIRMFDGEARMNDITIEPDQKHSYQSPNVDYVLVDPSRSMQILINFISNSVKFTAQRAERKITISYGAQTQRPPQLTSEFGDLQWSSPADPQRTNLALPPPQRGEQRLYLYFCVQDTGIGLDDDAKSRLFQRFSQGTSKTHISYGGSGLGLYICRELAESQGGGVGVASHAGSGSVFAFYIETRFAEGPDKGRTLVVRAKDDPTGTSTNEAVPTPKASDPRQCHVLLVEDNLVNQKVLAKQLRKENRVTVANHGEEALSVLEKQSYWSSSEDPIDVVLMDWEMPIMDGLECTRRIRTLEKEHRMKQRLPIIGITANVREEQRIQALAAGMDDVLGKPVKLGEIMAKMRETIENNKLDGK